MTLEPFENKEDKEEFSDRERLDYWKKMADILGETQAALRLEKTKIVDQKRIEWWKREAKKGLRH
jgi:hypothetical protein